MTADSGVQLGQIPNLSEKSGGAIFRRTLAASPLSASWSRCTERVCSLGPSGFAISAPRSPWETTSDVEDVNGIYYRQWLAALEKIVIDKNLSDLS